jgi:hypothetical protein
MTIRVFGMQYFVFYLFSCYWVQAQSYGWLSVLRGSIHGSTMDIIPGTFYNAIESNSSNTEAWFRCDASHQPYYLVEMHALLEEYCQFLLVWKLFLFHAHCLVEDTMFMYPFFIWDCFLRTNIFGFYVFGHRNSSTMSLNFPLAWPAYHPMFKWSRCRIFQPVPF